MKTTRILSITLIVFLALPMAAMADGKSPCERTARLAARACQNDVADDFLTALGNCLNLGDEDEAAECREEAYEELGEEYELCGERKDAREDLCELLDEELYDPDFDPENFLSPGEIAANPNPYFPLVPGYTWVFESEEEITTVVVLDRTIEIDGVECVVVNDIVTLRESGELIEDTLDWFTQDLEGNVWYVGEIAKNYEDGQLVDLEGSWKQGEDYAKAGILVHAEPYPGQAYRQEWYLREAEDAAEVVSLNADESSPFVSCNGGCLQTYEFTPIEPDAREYKYYVPGIGPILEVDLEDEERSELVSFSTGS